MQISKWSRWCFNFGISAHQTEDDMHDHVRRIISESVSLQPIIYVCKYPQCEIANEQRMEEVK